MKSLFKHLHKFVIDSFLTMLGNTYIVSKFLNEYR